MSLDLIHLAERIVTPYQLFVMNRFSGVSSPSPVKQLITFYQQSAAAQKLQPGDHITSGFRVHLDGQSQGSVTDVLAAAAQVCEGAENQKLIIIKYANTPLGSAMYIGCLMCLASEEACTPLP